LPAFALAFGTPLFLILENAHAAPPPEVYGNLPQAELMRVCPCGSRVAMFGVAYAKRQLIMTGVAQDLRC
jgi:hypothetical protein